MNAWDPHLLAPDALDTSWERGVGAVSASLLAHARTRWPLLERGLQAMERASRQRLSLAGGASWVELLCNPARLSSVTASPSATAPCVLCPENIPPEEEGIAAGERGEFVALPNPAPIIRNHIVFAHRSHVPQRLSPCLPDLAWLLARAGEETVFLYNGPTSGASSPHHLHLQAGLAEDLPLTFQRRFDPIRSTRRAWGEAHAVEAGGRRFLWLVISAPSAVPQALSWSLERLTHPDEHPLNLILWRHGPAVEAALFPRARHRPSCYHGPEDHRIVVSPGSVEMGGLVVLPRLHDWERVDEATLATIYREVCLDDRSWEHLLSILGS